MNTKRFSFTPRFSVAQLRASLCRLLCATLFIQPLLLSAPALAASNSRGVARSAGAPAKARAAKAKSKAAQGNGSLTVFGPRRFDRLPGPPRNVTETITVAGALVSSYVVRLQNGGASNADRVAGATIQLNGAVLATALTFHNNVAALDVPTTLQGTNTLTVRVTGAPDAYLTMSILARPLIVSLAPEMGSPGSTVMINGEGFDTTPSRNTVSFARAGGGTTTAQVSAATATKLTVIVPPDADTGRVTVQTEAGTATSPANFTLVRGPMIVDFNPKRGPIQTVVTITGTNFKPDATNPLVSFTGEANARIPAVVLSATATEIRVQVPTGTITGPIQVTNSLGSVTSIAVFSVETPLEWNLTLAPSSATTVQGSNATFVVYLTANLPTFTQLAKLSVTGLHAGIKASFSPEQMTAGAESTLTLVIPGNVSTGNYPFTIEARAPVNGSEVVKTVAGSVNVQLVSQTTLLGRVLSTRREPIRGATVSLDGISTVTDAAGNFLMSGVAAGTDRPLMVDGRTANAPNRTYPVIAEPITLIAGQANVVPYTLYLPAIDTAHEVIVVPNQITHVTTPVVPGLDLTIPANAQLTNRDGTPVTRASLTSVEIDRTPAPLPPTAATALVYTAQPGGARPASGVVLPVTYPNLGGADPGTRIALWNFNHDTVQWYVYGYGNVSADGRLIVPEPGVGLPDFSWHFAGPMDKCKGGDCCKTCPCPKTKDPVDLSSGMKIEETTDVSFGGARGGLELSRQYTTLLAGTCDTCPFGRGFNHNYAIRLTGTFLSGGAGRILWPKDLTGTLFSYVRAEADGTLVFSTTETPHQLGDVIRKLPNGSFEYRYKTGNLMRFDATGRLTAMVDRNNNTTTFSYTGNNLTQITDPVGRSLNLQYSGTRITQVTDPLNRVWRYVYDGEGHLITATDPLNNSMRYTYDLFSRIATITDKRGTVAKSLSYDIDGRVFEQRYPDGGFDRYSYTLSGMSVTSTTVTNALGRTKTMRFNGSGQVVGTSDELGQSAEITRDLTTNVALETKGPCGCREDKKAYDANGNPATVTDRLNQNTVYEYDPVFNNVTRMVDRRGNVTTYGYDSRGNRTSMTNALNQTTTYGYDQYGQMVSVTDALGHVTQVDYDTRGNSVARIDALGNRSVMEFDQIGRYIATTDPLGRRSSTTYDALDRILSVTDTANSIKTFEYDANGNRTKATNAQMHSWINNYDAKNRLSSTSDPLNRITRSQYNAVDELTAKISPSGRKITYDYDSRGLRVFIVNALTGGSRYAYDNRRKLISLTDKRGYVTMFGYDELFRVVTIKDPLGNITAYEYEPEGMLKTIVDRLGRRTRIIYDSLNRRSEIEYADARVGYEYDALGRQTRVIDSQGGSIDWEYDNASRVLSEKTQQGMISYTYNASNQRSSMTAPGRPSVAYTYDVSGRPKDISQGSEVFTYDYDVLSRIARLNRPNGVKSEWLYDQAGQLLQLTHSNSTDVVLENFQYSYNLDSEIERKASLSSATVLSSAKVSSVADPVNRIAQEVNLRNYSYNSEGQMIERSDSTGAIKYEWDARGRLVRAQSISGQSVDYRYDALGRLSSRSSAGLSTYYLNDDQDVVRDILSDGSESHYLNGVGIDKKLRSSNPSRDIYYLPDHVNSTIALTDSQGNVVERQTYTAFGESGLSLTRYGFTGREKDESTQLMYYRARWHDPAQGRFISEDPAGLRDQINLYPYVENNPINLIDPSGLASISDADLSAGAEYNFGFSGAGISVVTCCDENKNKIWMTFTKICLGLGVGVSVSGSVVIGMDGPRCRKETYEGWFTEQSFFYGSVTSGDGVGEIGVSYGVGFPVKYMRCFYMFVPPPRVEPKGCECP